MCPQKEISRSVSAFLESMMPDHDIHSEANFTFKELPFFVNETQKDDFCLECFAGSDDEALESINLRACRRRCW